MIEYSVSAPALAQTAKHDTTIVLVHGAFAESASWNGVAERLRADGYTVIAAANPLRGVASDPAYIGRIAASVHGPVVLVGHSYGGSVISQEAATPANVKALVYVAAFAPDAGEKAADLTARFPGSTLAETLAPPVALSVYDGSGPRTFQGSLDALRRSGTFCWFGPVLGGSVLGGPGPIGIMTLPKSIKIGYAAFFDSIYTPELLRKHSAQLFDWIREGKLTVKIGGAYPLAETAKAHADMESRATTGKLLLIP